MSDFFDFVAAKSESLTDIDTARFPRFFSKYRAKFPLPKIVHIVGTNGKGSTGRMIAEFLHKNSKKVAHFTSPHLFNINERFWIDGLNVSDQMLQIAHKNIASKVALEDLSNLSYFEYATIIFAELAIICGSEYLIVEAGLGGEFDATSSFDSFLTLVTPIDLDHTDILGDTVEKIATTKLKAVKDRAIIATQHHSEVYTVADTLQIDYKKASELDFEPDQGFFKSNIELAFSALTELGFAPKIDEIKKPNLLARDMQIAPNVFVDVGHNPFAAKALIEKYAHKKVTIIYNSYHDKDFEAILKLVRKITKNLLIYELKENPRVLKQQVLEQTLSDLGFDFEVFDGSFELRKNYLVFGSFSVVSHFLKRYFEDELKRL